jgi:hypothetical protein
MRLLRVASIAVGCSLALLACRGNDRGAVTTTTAGHPGTSPSSMGGSLGIGEGSTMMMGPALVPYHAATARITGARCDREFSCDQIGANKRFSTREICDRDQERRTQQDVKSSDCPNGVRENELATCLSRISSQDCSDLVTSVANVGACSPATLCAP